MDDRQDDDGPPLLPGPPGRDGEIPSFRDVEHSGCRTRGPSPAASSRVRHPARAVPLRPPPVRPRPRRGVRPGPGTAPGEAHDVYGALDLGTNNCRLLLARPSRRGFRVIDAFSRIIRLGEGVSRTGRLSPAAMIRTLEALEVCAAKMARVRIRRSRLVATEACRIAANGPEFLAEIKRHLGLDIEILTPEAEARLAVAGCTPLIDPAADHVLVFDIGGGSSELIWLDRSRRMSSRRIRGRDRTDAAGSLAAWTSLPAGVVTLAERFGGRHVTPETFEAMVAFVMNKVQAFEDTHGIRSRMQGGWAHFLGTSGTVTTVAGIRLGLPRYDRARVDGCWLHVSEVRTVVATLLASTYEERMAEPCIGEDRADLVLAGCAILEALLRVWPCERLRVADRGLREGILMTLMHEDGVHPARRRARGGKRRG